MTRWVKDLRLAKAARALILTIPLLPCGPAQADLARSTNAITGWSIDIPGLLKIGERRLNLLRAFNAREGFTREDDKLPKKLFQPLKGGKTDGVALTPEEIEQAKDLYYQMAGWDENGVPKPETLAKLGLDWIDLG